MYLTLVTIVSVYGLHLQYIVNKRKESPSKFPSLLVALQVMCAAHGNYEFGILAAATALRPYVSRNVTWCAAQIGLSYALYAWCAGFAHETYTYALVCASAIGVLAPF